MDGNGWLGLPTIKSWQAKPDKCHLLLSTQEEANIKINNTKIKCSKPKKLLGIIFDNKLKFDKHIENIY